MPPPLSTLSSLLTWGKVLAQYAPRSLEMCVRGLLRPVLPFSTHEALELRREAARRSLEQLGATLTVVDHNGGSYPSPPYIFALLNQTSLAEAFVIPQALPSIPHQGLILANIEYLLLPFVGWDCLATGAVVVFRGWPWQRQWAKQRAIEALANHKRSLYMSVEGRRSPTGLLQKYRHGCAAMALASGASIVPVVIKGATEVLPFGEWRVRPGGAITATLLPAIPTAHHLRGKDEQPLTRDEKRALIESITSQLRRLAERETGQCGASHDGRQQNGYSGTSSSSLRTTQQEEHNSRRQ